MKVGVLTSSRADYGIYLPLLRKMSADNYFEIHLLVFGTHMSERFGKTINQIEQDKFRVTAKFDSTPIDDLPGSISMAMANTMSSFTNIWDKEKFELVIALGDRSEMFAAVASLQPFNIPVAHIHGGETTLGAIDNAFRHSITHMSALHFTACEQYRNRVIELTRTSENVFNTGALSIDLLGSTPFYSKDQIRELYNIDIDHPSILVTFHPETVSYKKNSEYIKTLIGVLNDLDRFQLIISMPKADTSSNMIRDQLKSFISDKGNAIGIESLGSLGYLSCMKYCNFLLGNSSSGFVEASWFPKPVINIGRRQSGRINTPNIFSCNIDKGEILNAIAKAEKADLAFVSKIYGDGNAADKMIIYIKEYFKTK
jgi:GDP/UDP-N,N'-diacetylbacillosamine 2-epimerase (hydrolysing)